MVSQGGRMKNRKYRAAVGLLSLLAISSLTRVPIAAQQPAPPQQPTDSFVWLEDVEGQRSMEWVNAKNAATIAALTRSPLYQAFYDRIKHILDSKDKIAYPEIIGNSLYNFWKDAEHERGIWRRTSWVSYATANPSWETVLDLDSLSKAEGVTWSFGGADCFEPEYKRCIIALSRGGSDATETREFDLTSKTFVTDGFRIPEAKTSTAWVDDSTLFVGTDFGPGSMTTSGYPRIAKLWKRGTPLSSATTVFEVPPDHVAGRGFRVDAGDRRYLRLSDAITFYESAEYLYDKGKAIKIDVLKDADLYLVRDQIVVYVRDPWTVGGRTWPTGSLVAMSFDDFLAGKRDLQLVMQPGARETINGISLTHDYLIITVVNNVRGELRRYHHQDGGWTFEKVPAPDLGTVSVVARTPRSDRYFFSFTNFIDRKSVV